MLFYGKVEYSHYRGGAFSHTHIEGALASHNVNLVCVCETDEEKAQTLREQYKIKVINDMEEIFNDPTIQGVTLPLPDQVHCEVSIKAMRAGKHVLCEKPMALKLDECKEMIRVSKETGKFLMVGQICRFTPAFVRTKELIEAGEIGELFFAESEYAHDYSKLGASWRFHPNSPRHGLIGGGCHAVDLLRWLCGNPIQVFGYSNRKVLKNWPTDDAVIAVMDMPNDVKAKIFCSIGCKRRYTMRTVLYGTEGTIICDNLSLPRLAEIANLSTNYYGTLFKALNGVTPVEYITSKRVLYAISLLPEFKGTMLELALSCGFNNTANFNRAFRTYTGQVPSKYVPPKI